MEINRIYCEDCLETMKRMPDNFIDLVVTSPPYDNLRDYHGFTFDFESIAKELYRVMKPGGVIVWVVGDATIKGSETGTSFKQALFFKEVGFNLHDTMIYLKNNPIPLTHNRYEQQFEYMFIFSKGRPKNFNPIMQKCKRAGKKNNYKNINIIEKNKAKRKRDEVFIIKEHKIKGNVWDYNLGKAHGTVHPATFLEKLSTDHIISWSNPGDLVYDPFMGSGTTAISCIKNNRNYIGSEISEEYCKIINSRIEKAQMNLTLNLPQGDNQGGNQESDMNTD